MNIERLVSMANQIGVFFEAQPDRDDAILGIADHLKRFWEPRMLEGIHSHWLAGGEGLKEIVADALKKLAEDKQKMSS
jgi:formate dehydrogenase subunit delta